MSAAGYQKSSLSGFDLAIGDIPGAFQFATFGFADNVDTTDPPVDVWNGFQIDGLTVFTLSTTADIDTISSSNALDTQLITIFGLDSNREWSIQVAQLNGQNKVTLDTPLVRINRVININGTDIAGVVRVYVDGPITAGVPDVLSTIRGYINQGDNISEQALFSTPSNFRTQLLNTFTNVGKASQGAGEILADIETRFKPLNSVSILSGHFTISTQGSGIIRFESPVPVPLLASADIFWRVTDVSANGTRINCGFNFELYPD